MIRFSVTYPMFLTIDNRPMLHVPEEFFPYMPNKKDPWVFLMKDGMIPTDL